jgi:(R,R)-butanediol dehydrogenase/meso-butanediol dehydrogenase/diacetyl reductase
VIDGTRKDVIAAIRAAAGGLGPDVAFEYAGIPAVLQIHLNDLVFSEAYLTGIIGYLGDHPATIGLLADDLIDVGFFITTRIKLDKLVDGGFHELIQNKDEHLKVLVHPWTTGRGRPANRSGGSN